jgi:hypothetical protein
MFTVSKGVGAVLGFAGAVLACVVREMAIFHHENGLKTTDSDPRLGVLRQNSAQIRHESARYGQSQVAVFMGKCVVVSDCRSRAVVSGMPTSHNGR